MLDHAAIYDALYLLAADNGREEALFGNCQPLARSPFALELQFDVLPDGSVGPTIGVSAGLPVMTPSKLRPLFAEGGAAEGLMRQVECRGLADVRWRLVPEASFARLAETGDGPLAMYCAPTFVKLRVRGGEPLDAKVYLQAGAR